MTSSPGHPRKLLGSDGTERGLREVADMARVAHLLQSGEVDVEKARGMIKRVLGAHAAQDFDSESLARCATHPDCVDGMVHEIPHIPQ